MVHSLMEEKRLDLNAPLLSARRFGSAPPPPPPSSSSSSNTAAAAANSRAQDGGGAAAGQGPRRSPLPSYKSDWTSGPLRNAGVVPFVWEQSPGQPKDGSSAGGDAGKLVREPLVAPRPPPGRIFRRLPDVKEEPISTEAINPSPISSTSTSAAHATAASTPLNGSFSISSGSSKEHSKVNLKTKPVISKAPIVKEQRSSNEEEDEEEEDAFSDAFDTLSRAESCYMSCSVSGLSAGVEPRRPSGRFSTDPQVRDFMMGRFLPAAQAMATASPQFSWRKPSVPSRDPARRVLENVGERRRPAVPLPYQCRPNYALSYSPVQYQKNVGNGDNGDDNDDEDDGYDDAGPLPMKGCGLLPRFCLLNPVPAMKARGRMPRPAARRLSPQVRYTASHHGSAGDAEDEHTWEEVYSHKLGRVQRSLGEEASKLTSESNQLSYWSDSQTADGSSSYRRSIGGGISPYRNDMPRSPWQEGKGVGGVRNHETRSGEDDDVFESCSKDGEKYWEITPHLGSKQTSGSPSPVINETVFVDAVKMLEKSASKLSLSDTESAMNPKDVDFEIMGESQRIEESLMFDACESNVLQHKVTESIDADEPSSAKGLGALVSVDDAQDHALDGPQNLETEHQRKNDINALQALVPPPLPKSPSESWLLRTLPSVASMNSTPLSFLGIHPKKQAIRASFTDPRWETMLKQSVAPKGQMRFADVLAKPVNED